ncbi:MAG TPA: ATP-binding protein [Bryobacteraceae bacterium]|nr:ATP-binding protein [Bryobacteraceae bacterium]
MGESVRVLIDEASKTSEARRSARGIATKLGLNETVSEQIGIVATEACTNLLKHAGRGEIILDTSSDGLESSPWLDLLALDQGPGMRNLEQSLQDGFSTGSTSGHGLGAIVRLSQESDFYTVPQKGTGILARWRSQAPKPVTAAHPGTLRIGAINLPKLGEEVSGDAWGAVHLADSVVILLADGLGHGVEAHIAASEAVRMLRLYPELPPAALIERVHGTLRSTRGAAVAVARIDLAYAKLIFAGVGNISGRIYSGSEGRQGLTSVNGTAGHQIGRLQEFSYPWPADGLLQLHSDGLLSGTGLEPYPRLSQRDPALIAGVLYRDFARGRDDSTVVIAKAP